jgi:hypothetical protein
VFDENGSGVNLTVKSPSPLLRIHPATNKDAFPALPAPPPAASIVSAAQPPTNHSETTRSRRGENANTSLALYL